MKKLLVLLLVSAFMLLTLTSCTGVTNDEEDQDTSPTAIAQIREEILLNTTGEASPTWGSKNDAIEAGIFRSVDEGIVVHGSAIPIVVDKNGLGLRYYSTTDQRDDIYVGGKLESVGTPYFRERDNYVEFYYATSDATNHSVNMTSTAPDLSIIPWNKAITITEDSTETQLSSVDNVFRLAKFEAKYTGEGLGTAYQYFQFSDGNGTDIIAGFMDPAVRDNMITFEAGKTYSIKGVLAHGYGDYLNLFVGHEDFIQEVE